MHDSSHYAVLKKVLGIIQPLYRGVKKNDFTFVKENDKLNSIYILTDAFCMSFHQQTFHLLDFTAIINCDKKIYYLNLLHLRVSLLSSFYL